MVVLNSATESEASRCAEVAVFEDDALRQRDARKRFSGRDRVANRAAFDLQVVSTSSAGSDAVELQLVRNLIWPVDFRPRPGKRPPRSTDFATDQRLDGAPLYGVCPLVDQDDTFATPFVNGAGPI